MDPQLKKLEEDRSTFYGDPEQSHTAIGLAWEGIVRNHNHHTGALDLRGHMFPAWLVALMLAAFKVVRAARPQLREDSYDDAAVYLDFSKRFRCKNMGYAQEVGLGGIDAAKGSIVERDGPRDRESIYTPRPTHERRATSRTDLRGGIRGGLAGSPRVNPTPGTTCPNCG